MDSITITDVDSVHLRIACERGLAKELSDYFTFKVPGHQYMPAFKKKVWDGQIKLYNLYSQTIYKGLYDYVLKFAQDRNYGIEIPTPIFTQGTTTQDHVRKYVDEFLKPSAGGSIIKAHDHQVEAICHAMNNDRCLLLSPTGSGKSLIIYSLVRYYLDKISAEKKILIIVPTTSLVQQMYSDFKEYASNTSWSVSRNCHYVFAGREKINNKRVVITTWQSIYRMDKSYFDNFGAVFGDECHQFKSKSLTAIMTKLTTCPYRIGTTGTLDGTLTHKLVIEGLFGRVKQVTSTKQLMDSNLLSKLKIDCIVLRYPPELCKRLKGMKYPEEIDWLVQNRSRNKFIQDLASTLKGNTLILYQFVEKHGKVLYEMMKKMPNKEVYFIHGGTDVESREEVRKIAEKHDSAIIIASYGTFSTGISIRRLHNIVFSSPSKSRIRVLQSIGRQLRTSEHKDLAKLYDIADDIRWKSHKNHTLLHFLERLKIYKSELFDYKLIHLNTMETDINE